MSRQEARRNVHVSLHELHSNVDTGVPLILHTASNFLSIKDDQAN